MYYLNTFDWDSLSGMHQKYCSKGILSDYITFIEDVNLATGEFLVINEGKWIARF